MINDSSSMGETLSKYLPYETERLTRSRGTISKAIGLAVRILRARADIYHVFYILQDTYLSLKIGKKPAVGHACGSDIRDTLHSKWGWMVRYGLRNLDYVLSAQPTLVPRIKEYTGRVEYFPIPIDPQLFTVKPLRRPQAESIVFYSSPVNFRVKGTDKVLDAISKVRCPLTLVAIKYGADVGRAIELSGKLAIKARWIDPLPHSHMASYYWAADLVLGNFGVGQLDTTVVEAMACGRPVVHHLAPGFYPGVPLNSYDSVEEFANDLEMLLMDQKKARGMFNNN